MNILVTGGAGYIGSHTVRALVNKKHRVVVLDNLSKGHPAAVKEIELVRGDTSDRQLLKRLLTGCNIEAVMHFAASSLVGESVRLPSDYYRNNVVNGLTLLDAAVEAGVRYFVFSSTAAVYGEPIEVPITENHPATPLNPYGATKLALEGAMRWYGEAYGLRYTSLRYFNAAGADPAGDIGEDHEPETHLIPLVMKAALGLIPQLEIFGDDYPTPDGTCVRDYIHVNDLADAHILALEAMAGGAGSNIYNLGNGNGYSVLEVIETAKAVTGSSIPVKYAARRAGDPAVLVAGSERIKDELGWRPAFPGLREIIETAWRWHSNHPGGYEK
ncbi:MAG: UDP-glucose 4-epimerase [Pelotomaculum sp. PtaB.Bin013]|uniref:UDP-glucose 4-epimerase n=1 Tax=Pelotomaculum isophthalicicum JI TaxID=947010 RepID=A0A9X4GZW0_9FIRM|nr:UDP-glucose 4-epimerase GalE [Pelotomaculum isophthalicicum]MDF9409215.1 UDP-glucose 4-epimerase GalE [Pelotomaculum isophthalicicum JI]OPX92151.1 MAG: UDP-glucose 4-epimerase [Pelotomaculum sp. PtaB.Bin013]